ncbi:MAG: anti-sigma factor [Acetobacteraceae bacterium]
MECERAAMLLSGLVDRALGPLARLRVQRHVARCHACAGRLEELRAMRALRTRLPYHRAPPDLAARIGSVLPRDEAPPVVRPWFRASAIRLAGTGLAGAIAGAALTLLVAGGPDDPVSAIIGSHVRSLQPGHLTDVATSDQHTVKPWLSARLDVSPPTRDFATQGFPLIGGRLDYVDGHQAATVVYGRARHVINLFAWASSGPDEGFRTQARQGFNIVSWRRDGVCYHAVSDLEADQLAAFARLVTTAP